MQTMNISGREPQSEGWFKRLFWPSIQTSSDVDSLGSQGYWLCALVAVVSFAFLIYRGHPILGLAVLLVYYLGGVGVREHNRYAAIVVFVLYALDTVMSPGLLRIILSALLLSNVRATWIASAWRPESPEAAPPIRLNETWGDKFADQLPQWLWPKVRILYYVLSAGYLAFIAFGFLVLITRRHP